MTELAFDELACSVDVELVPSEMLPGVEAYIHILRTDRTTSTTVMTGIWACEPTTFPYIPSGIEGFHILDGRGYIDFPSGRIELRPGVVGSLPAGTACTWHVDERLTKFFVVTEITEAVA